MYKVGIPRALLYWRYFALWRTFFEELNCEVVLSPMTNLKIAQTGIKLAVDDICLPVKIALGHVLWLVKQKIQVIFLPYVISTEESGYMCPKFAGFPDMVRATLPHLPTILDPCLDVKHNYFFDEEFTKVAKVLNPNKRSLKRAIEVAKRTHSIFFATLRPKKGSSLVVGLIGHPYNIYDVYINHGIVKKLKEMDVSVITPEMLPHDLYSYLKNLPKDIYWSLGRELVASAVYLAKNKLVDGVIYVVSFACALDSILQEIVHIELKHLKMPYMQVVLDEHTEAVGLFTRVEAFIELIRRRS